jgi:hypothetical protein
VLCRATAHGRAPADAAIKAVGPSRGGFRGGGTPAHGPRGRIAVRSCWYKQVHGYVTVQSNPLVVV